MRHADSKAGPESEAVPGGAGDAAEKDGSDDGGAAKGSKERTALLIGFTLKSSSYATMCVRELLKRYSEEAALGLRDAGDASAGCKELKGGGDLGGATDDGQ